MAEYVELLSYVQLVGLCAAVLGGLIAIMTGVGFALEAWLGAERTIFDLPLADGQLRWELFGTLRFLVMGTFAFAGLLWFVPFAEESPIAIATTFFVCFSGFEIYYWCMHRAMHFKPLYRFHRYHHDSRVTSPLTGYSMSTTESAGWLVGLVGIPLLLGMATPISLVGFLAYHAFYQVSGNVIGHANVDFFPAAIEKRRNSWIGHPTTFHSLHHARFTNHYSFGGGTFMDRLFGTEWPDWPELHARVIRGESLKKLSVRGATNPAP